MSGYTTTNDKDEAPRRMLEGVVKTRPRYVKGQAYLYQFNWVSTASPADSCTPRNPIACVGVISPLANGRSFVLSDTTSGVQNKPLTIW